MRLIPWLAMVLIVANLGFCVWTQGGFGEALPPPGAAQREPARLRQQVRPETVVVLSPKAASAALAQIAAESAAGASAAGVVQPASGPSAAERGTPARTR